MKRIMAMADRAALFSLSTLVVLNLLFLLSFLLLALIAARTVDTAPQFPPAASSATVPSDGLSKA